MTLRKRSWLERGAVMVFGVCALAVACGVSESPPEPNVSGAWDGAAPAAISGSGSPTIAGATQAASGSSGAGRPATASAATDGAGPISGTSGLPPAVWDGSGPLPCVPKPDLGADAGVSDDGDAGLAADGGGTITCRSAPRGGNPQESIACEKKPGSDTWTCHCPGACVTTCSTRSARPCGFNNCCGVQTEICPLQVVNAAPSDSCQSGVKSGTMTACGVVAEGGASVSTSCCPPSKPFFCPGGGCFARPEEAREVCPGSCVECAPAPRRDAIGLGHVCGRTGDAACPTGSDCIKLPSVPAPQSGFCSPTCSAFASTPQCPFASAPPGIRTGCAGPMDGYLSDHCFIANDGCASSCPSGFHCLSGDCFPDG